MYVLKGFANNSLFAINTPGTNSVIGEISTQSLTYSKELGQYVSTQAPDIVLISFDSNQDGTAVAIQDAFKERTLGIIQWIYQYTVSHPGQIFADQFLQSALVQYQGKASNFQCGAIVGDAQHTIAEWVSWTDTGDATFGDNQVKVWFADASFSQQYDEGSITIVPPLTPLDDFFKQGNTVEQLLNSRTLTQTMQLVQTAKGGFPESYLRTDTYNYVDPNDATHLVPSNWTALIYGIALNNIDSVKDATIAYILANSEHSRDEWAAILPDLFKRTEFVMVPLWNQTAIPTQTNQLPIYSPIAQAANVVSTLQQYASNYDPTFVATNATSMGQTYKSISIAAIGSADNKNSQFKLSDVYPDYIVVPSTSPDFNRMSAATRDWAMMLDQMVQFTETMTINSIIPQGFTRLVRNGKLFLVGSRNNINYLVAAKSNFS